MKNKTEKYNEGKLPKLWDYLVELHQKSPEVFNVDGKYLRAIVAQKWKALDNATQCPNCRASMQQYEYSVSYAHANLVRAMSRRVRLNMSKGMGFTEANQVHLQKDISVDYTTASSQTQARFLGLIAKVTDDEGKHLIEKGWLITRRGFDFLNNEPVPKSVVAFRNEIVERPEGTTTIQEIFTRNNEDYDVTEHYAVYSIAKGVL